MHLLNPSKSLQPVKMDTSGPEDPKEEVKQTAIQYAKAWGGQSPSHNQSPQTIL